jgi:hypothetical protein
MRFTVHIPTFLHMVRVVTGPSGMPIGSRDRLLRITATGRELVISANRSEGGCEAEIAEEGVCFFRYQRLQQLLQGYRETTPEQDRLELEITPEGVRVGQTMIDRAGWEVSLFRDPATAPRKLRFSTSGEGGEEREPEPDLQMRMSF